jgi:predicted cupin superfamily sugar epimerase
VTPRAAELIRILGLSPHPEGGAYRETWRSPSPPSERAAATTISFLLDRGELSRWHRVDADEIWTHLEGGPLELFTWVEGREVERRVLGPVDAAGIRPVAVVSAGVWQAARPADGYVLSGCTVAPGFEFKSFSLMGDDAALAARFRTAQPDYADLI